VLFGSDGALGILGASSDLLVRQSFSQEYELEADAAGWDYMVAAGMDPRGLEEMLRKFQAEEKKHDSHGAIQAFSSHPATPRRIRRLQQKWEKYKDKERFAAPGDGAANQG
jgi:predicted Zn-dependent protease